MAKIKKILLIIIILLPVTQIKPQAFGFGCLGFVGGYGGYSYQIYKPTGLNNYVKAFNMLHSDSLDSPMGQFGKSNGFRIGLNFFRANIEGFILTAKGFYQVLSEQNKAVLNSQNGNINSKYEIELKNWGIGIDLGTEITGALSWKVIDAALLFNTATFTNTENFPGAKTVIEEFNSDKSSIGYSIGTGFIISIIDQYVSLEGLAGYTVIKIEQVKLSTASNQAAAAEIINQFIENGGFNAVIQLNVGFPL